MDAVAKTYLFSFHRSLSLVVRRQASVMVIGQSGRHLFRECTHYQKAIALQDAPSYIWDCISAVAFYFPTQSPNSALLRTFGSPTVAAGVKFLYYHLLTFSHFYLSRPPKVAGLDRSTRHILIFGRLWGGLIVVFCRQCALSSRLPICPERFWANELQRAKWQSKYVVRWPVVRG